MLKEKLIKKARKNNWEIEKNCGGGVNIIIPWEYWGKIYNKINKSNLSFKWRTTWDYKEIVLSIF